MVGVAVEQMLDLWCTELRQVKAHLRALFPHPSVAASAAAFLDGLLGPERRKTGWMRAEAAGDPGPWRQQAVGLTHNETRSWHGWHRHVSLVMLAFAMMAVVRQHANRLTSPQKRNDGARLQRWYAGLSRKSAGSPHASPSAGSSLPS